MAAEALEVRNLTVSIVARSGARANVVEDVSFAVPKGGTFGLVGESGSGKTMTALAVMGMLPPAARVERGEILLDGLDLLKLSTKELRAVRGKRIAMAMQDPMTALDPSFTIRSQVEAPLRRLQGLRRTDLKGAAVDALARVYLPTDAGRLQQYPHQLSGGMRQRVVSAIALSGEPEMLIADEPTTALDVTTQAQYLSLLADLQQQSGFGLLLIAHDLLVVRSVCQTVAVMYSGRIVETGSAADVFGTPSHPYTRALIKSVPVMGSEGELEAIEGQAPELGEILAGCSFAPRCEFKHALCHQDLPELRARDAAGHLARCWATERDGWLSKQELS